MNFYIVLLLIPVLRTQAYWQIKWRDEFDKHTIDSTKWDVINEDVSCDGNYIQQINCKTNNSRNLWLVDGTLAIAAVPEKEKYLEKDYTSAMIMTKEGFTFGKFEIRAALPKGKMLRPAMYFIPIKNTGQWPKDGQMELMTNIQTQSLGSGIHVIRQYNQFIGKEYTTRADLKLFHSYILEWNQSMIVWKFDEIQYFTINLTEELANYYNPYTSPFKIVITLGVGGKFFSDSLTKDDTHEWYCSLLILDYVRIYEWIDENQRMNTTDLIEASRSTPDAVCHLIMPLIKLAKKTTFPFTVVISALSLILLLALIPFVIYVFIRQKKLKLNASNSDEYYEDTQQEVYYEDIKDNEYADPYKTQNTSHYTNESTTDSMNKSPNNYIQMTNKYVTN